MTTDYKKIIAKNKRAIYDYFIEETIEAGIMLQGSEVKSARAGKINLADSHAAFDKGELFLYNCHVAEYEKANRFNHNVYRIKKLLLSKKELQKMLGKINTKGYTLIALSAYFNHKNLLKIELGIAKGKKQYDKRQTIKEREWKQKANAILRKDKY